MRHAGPAGSITRPVAEINAARMRLVQRVPSRAAMAAGRALPISAFVLLALVLLRTYGRLSLGLEVNSDQATNVLQAQSLLHGNLPLRGWYLSGPSFYLPDLYVYALTVWLRGVGPTAMHEAGNVIYVLLVLVSMLLARGDRSGWAGTGRMLVTLVLMAAPSAGLGVQLLLFGPHVGTTLLVAVTFLLLDRVRTGPWALAAAVPLGVAVWSDALALVAGVVPLLAVGGLGVRLWRLDAPRWRDAVLCGVALLAVVIALAAAELIRVEGGFATVGMMLWFASPDQVPVNANLAVQGLLTLFGADFLGMPVTRHAVPAVVHLAGFLLAVGAGCAAARAWLRGRDGEPTDQVAVLLLLAAAATLAAYVLTSAPVSIMTSRYLTPAYAALAILGGRAGGPWLWRQRLAVPAGIVAAGYVLTMWSSLQAPVAPAAVSSPVGDWLVAHGLRHGLGAYWQAEAVTVGTSGRANVIPVTYDPARKAIVPFLWEADASWYRPQALGDDTVFLVYDAQHDDFGVDRQHAVATFGQPAHVYRVGDDEVLVWDHSLTRYLASS